MGNVVSMDRLERKLHLKKGERKHLEDIHRFAIALQAWQEARRPKDGPLLKKKDEMLAKLRNELNPARFACIVDEINELMPQGEGDDRRALCTN